MSDQETAGTPTGISRRTVTKAAVWAVPAVAVAAAVPIASASVPPVIINFSASSACKIPGSSWGSRGYVKGYVLWASIKNSTTSPALVKIISITVGGIAQTLVGTTDPAACSTALSNLSVAANTSKTYAIFSNASTDSSSTAVSVTFQYSLDGGSTWTTATVSGNVTGSSWTTGGGSCTPPGNCSSTGPLPV